MPFLKNLWKKAKKSLGERAKNKMPGKQPEPARPKPVGEQRLPRISEEELPRAQKMAERLAGMDSFAGFCAKNRLGEPRQAFLNFYAEAIQNTLVWKKEAKAEEAAEKAGKSFSRTSYYGKLFMKCTGNPKNISSVLFEG